MSTAATSSARARAGAPHQRSVFVLTNGCPENRIDSAAILQQLQDGGWRVTADFTDADLILFNTCGLTQEVEQNVERLSRQLQAGKQPAAQLLICGCLPRINPTLAAQLSPQPPQRDWPQLAAILATGTSDVEGVRANTLVPFTSTLGKAPARDPLSLRLSRCLRRRDLTLRRLGEPLLAQLARQVNVYTPHSFCIKISSGCLNSCAFCAVNLSRGRVKSKPEQQILAEFDEGLSRGCREFALIGTDLGAYGRDRQTNLARLLGQLIARPGDYQIRLRNIQPRFLLEMLPEMAEIFASGRISYVSSAAESGSDRVLQRMGRGYTASGFLQAIKTVQAAAPQVQLRTQLMVGFPEETEQDFEQTLQLLDQLAVDFVEVYNFEPRPGTAAVAMRHGVPSEVAQRRFCTLYTRALLKSWPRKLGALAAGLRWRAAAAAN